MRDTGIEPVTSSVSGKRSPAELNAQTDSAEGPGADDETRTRDPHLGKVMRYQLRYIRIAFTYFCLPGGQASFALCENKPYLLSVSKDKSTGQVGLQLCALPRARRR